MPTDFHTQNLRKQALQETAFLKRTYRDRYLGEQADRDAFHSRLKSATRRAAKIQRRLQRASQEHDLEQD